MPGAGSTSACARFRAGNQLNRVGFGIRSQVRGTALIDMLPDRCPAATTPTIDGRARSGETERSLLAVRAQDDRPHGRVERRDQRLARTDLEPAATEACARRAHRERRRCRMADQPARPAGTANLELDGQPLTGRELLLGPQSPVPDGDRDDSAVGPPDHDARDTSRIARLHDVGQGLGVRLDTRLRPPQQRGPGCDGTRRERQPRRARTPFGLPSVAAYA